MVTSVNGWSIKPAARTTLVVDDILIGGVRSGDVFTVLQYVATRFHREVEPLRVGQCGGYNPRKIAGSTRWSNHASATAIDLNWDLHQQGAYHTFSPMQQAALNRILKACNGVVRWGGTFSKPDPMHLEIDVPPDDARLAELARMIKNPPKGSAMDWSNPVVQALNFFYSEAYRAEQGRAKLPFPAPGTRAPTAQEQADRAARNAYVYLSHVDGVDPEPTV